MKISVVIPTLDEAQQIADAIGSATGPAGRSANESPLAVSPGQTELRAPRAASDRSATRGELEVVVVDGGSRDDTVARAEEAGAQVVSSERGRAVQLQAGVSASAGDIILFLHCDTRLPSGWQAAVERAVAAADVSGGAFGFRFRERSPSLRVIECGARLRSRWLGMPYGDQAIFARRTVLDAVGGVPAVPLMEDLDLVAALKRHGRIVILDLDASTSARRHQAGGVWRTATAHAMAALFWGLGVRRSRIAGWLGR